ncbi:hypothetical protein J3459_017548 [Metarhizium acridum]|uniref:Uncharacterized protein n=1 Tax=Metarhizium acridum (strain CQMa 102) TaxID=655827 RepID=E9EAA1_METAQ|nr:uncharacterized protein MAC_06800 [Metarhizium acridum CQMa 102]EFY87122.1 hypothetical protein MAC_06800 [Metarhizium acridum CQMa 102]KAG8408469.1 hypothetical protein J3458_019504 [Metarhizium acridum]KAG8409370.1 hypothetical protein J3459_017548 [Metarhizium acridum]
MASHEDKPQSYPMTNTCLAVPEKTAKGPSTRVSSLERTSSGTTARSDNCNPFETDVEAMATNSSLDKPRSSVILTRNKDCQVWPNKRDWKQRAKAGKQNRTCAFMQRFNRRTRIMLKVLIIVLVVGIAVAVGFGVSKPLGAPIWGDKTTRS